MLPNILSHLIGRAKCEIIAVMKQSGFMSIGVLFFLLAAVVGIFYGGYLFMGIVGNSQQVMTDHWSTIDGKTLGFIHPKDWKVQEKDNGDGSEVYLIDISCFAPLGQKITASITYLPTIDQETLLCNDEAKKYASAFQYLLSKREGYKCVFKNYNPAAGTTGETTAYIYTFLDDKETSTVTVDVRVPKWSLPDPVLEKKLDSVVASINFKF